MTYGLYLMHVQNVVNIQITIQTLESTRIKPKPHRLNFISNDIYCYRPGQKIEYRAFKGELYIMIKLDSNELIKELNKLQKWNPNEGYNPMCEDNNGIYIEFNDVENIIKDMTSND